MFRGPRLLTQLGEVLLIRYFPDGKVSLMPEVAMYNEGGRVAVVLQVSGVLKSRNESRETKLIWFSNLTTDYLGTPEANTRTRFESFPATMFVSKSEAAIKRVDLASQHAFLLTSGDHEFIVQVLSKGRKDSINELKRTIRLRQEDADFLAANRPKPGEPARNLRLHFNHDLNCYVSTLPAGWRAAATAAGSPALAVPGRPEN